MSVIRISKVTKELNVGLSTIVDFLQKKGYSPEKNPNAKISEEEYFLLIQTFDNDKYIKIASEKLSKKHFYKRKKIESKQKIYEKSQLLEEMKIEISEQNKSEVVITDKIDLPRLVIKESTLVPVIEIEMKRNQKMGADTKFERKIEEKSRTIPSLIAKQETEQETEQETSKQNEDRMMENETFLENEEDIEKKKIVSNITSKVLKEKDVKRRELSESDRTDLEKNYKRTPFRLPSSSSRSIGFTVTGKIDLSSINLATRPKRKTKEEKKKECEKRKKNQEKILIFNQKTEPKFSTLSKKNSEENQKKGRRIRIKSGKIDIESNNQKSFKSERRPSRFIKPVSREIKGEDIKKQIKETLAKLTGAGLKKGIKYRKEKREAISLFQHEQRKIKAQERKILKITEFVTANDLANMMNVPVNQIISTCMSIDLMVSINQRLDAETIDLVASEFGYQTDYVDVEVVESIADEEDRIEDCIRRPPIVTVMGHVDHGKTSLLDFIRNTNVIAGEAGGITQHIGAYHVKLENGSKITFLDTPGHEVFTAMRARGAKSTDIAIIVIAADDNVMPQTIEAINHVLAAGVSMVFAINKIDKPGANPEKIKETLSSMNYLVEDWGGMYQSQDISAKKGIGVKELLEKVLLEADFLDLKSNPTKKATGLIIESSLDRGKGYISTILVQNGTLKIGDIVLSGINYGRIKAMFNERNQRVKKAGPSEPVLILGLNGAPQAGNTIRVLATEHEARELAIKREQLQREQGLRTQKLLTLDDISKRIAIGNFQLLKIIVRGDVDGSIEALSDALIGLSTEQIQIKVIHKGVGQISESDVILAAASNAFIVGFQVRPSQSARKLAKEEGVDIRLYTVIYHAIEDVKSAMKGMLVPEVKEDITANVEVREVFKIAKIGTVAGCLIKEGKINRDDKIRLIRDGVVVYDGELGSLKRFKDDVKEVLQGYECGLNIRNFNDIKVGDVVESFRKNEVKQGRVSL